MENKVIIREVLGSQCARAEGQGEDMEGIETLKARGVRNDTGGGVKKSF